MKNKTIRRVSVVLTCFLATLGCSRSETEVASSLVHFQFQSVNGKIGPLSQPIPANKKACYAVHLQAPEFPKIRVGGVCGPLLTKVSGFVAEGQELSLEVQKGSGRVFELWTLLVDTSQSCPTSTLEDIASINPNNIYFSGSSPAVSLSKDTEMVTINYDFPGENQSMAVTNPYGACVPNLKASLTSDGTAFSADGNVLAISHPLNEGFVFTPLTDALGLTTISAGGMVNFLNNAVVASPAQVYSISRKPDSGQFVALLGEGQVVNLRLSAGSNSLEFDFLQPCLFQTCQVPAWIQSISPGFGGRLYGLDHAGQIYELLPRGPVFTGTSVPGFVIQVAYY